MSIVTIEALSLAELHVLHGAAQHLVQMPLSEALFIVFKEHKFKVCPEGHFVHDNQCLEYFEQILKVVESTTPKKKESELEQALVKALTELKVDFNEIKGKSFIEVVGLIDEQVKKHLS